MPASNFPSKAFYVIVLVCISGSIFFQILPNAGSILYVGKTTMCRTCSTGAEWVWIGATCASLSLPRVLGLRPETVGVPHHAEKRRVLFVFLALNVTWFVAALRFNAASFATVEAIIAHVGAKAAWPALWNLALTVFPIKRSSDVLALSHKDMEYCHVWAGRAILFWLVVHTVLLSIKYNLSSDSFSSWLSVMIPREDLYSEGVVNFMGWIALLSYLILWTSSQQWFRDRFFESFTWLHLVLSFVFVLFSNLHDYNTLHFLQPAIAAWVTDRLLRRYSALATTAVAQQHSREESAVDERGNASTREGELVVCIPVDPDTKIVSLTFSIPRTWSIDGSLGSGMFVYVRDPSFSIFQSHPFSISVVDTDRMTFTIHVKALGDWTAQFVENMQRMVSQTNDSRSFEGPVVSGQESLRLRGSLQKFGLDIEGPYGSDMCTVLAGRHYKRRLFIAGGVGLTGVSEAIARGRGRNEHQTLIWMVRTREEMDFLSKDMLHGRILGGSPNTTTTVKIFITQQQSRHQRSSHLSKANDSHLVASSSHEISYGSRLPAAATFAPTTTLCASIVGLALSFLFARLVCCYKPTDETVEGVTVHTCSRRLFAPAEQTCIMCSSNVDPESLLEKLLATSGISEIPPCCTIEICYLCFRGLPVVATLFGTPALTFLLVRVTAWIRQRWNSHLSAVAFKGCCCFRSSLARPMESSYHYENAIEEVETPPRNSGNGQREATQWQDEPCVDEHGRVVYNFEQDLQCNNIQIDPAVVADVVVEFRRPSLSQILGEFSINISDHDQACTDGEDEDVALVVCGSVSLLESVKQEVRRHQECQADDGESSSSSSSSPRLHFHLLTAGCF